MLSDAQPAQTTATAALLAAATALDYALFLGWDQVEDRDPATGALTGPYGAWQVAGCLLVLLALGLWAARHRQPLVVFTVPLVFTLCWAVDAATGL